MKKTLQLLIALFTFAFASAQDDIPATVGDYDLLINNDLEARVVAYTGAGGEITIPASVEIEGNPFPVVAIGEKAFFENTTITKVILPTTVTVLEREAFSGCTGIVTMNCDNIVRLSIASLSGLTSLTDYGTFNSLTTMDTNSFFNLSSLKEFELPDTLTNYNIGVGNTFRSVKTFNIPSTVTFINNAFFRFIQLTGLQVNWTADELANVTINAKNFIGSTDHSLIALYVPVGTKAAYEQHAILGNLNVIEGELPEIDETLPAVGDVFTEGDYDFTVTSIDPLEAEVSGSTLANVVVPATATDAVKNATYAITAVGISAFLGDVVPEADDAVPGININSTLVSVVLPASVKTIKNNAFTRCQNLESINLENIVTIQSQNVFFDCPKLTVANLDSATDIGNFAFHGLNNSTLTSISIPKAVNISKSAFRTSQITSIDIPASVLTIGSQVFMDCTALTEVKVNWATAEAIPAIDVSETTTEINPDTNEEETKIGTATFQDVDIANVTLVVPAGTMELYQAVDGWNGFNIEEEILASTDAVARELGFNIVSNVVSNTISVENNNLKQATITIVNVNGSVLLTTTANNLQNSIDVSGLSTGIYLMKVSTDEYTFVERIVKQ